MSVSAIRFVEQRPPVLRASPVTLKSGAREREVHTFPDEKSVRLCVIRLPPFQTNRRSIRELPIVRVSFRSRL